MKINPLLQRIILLVLLAGVIYGTYSATMDQLPDLSGNVVGNTTNNPNNTNHTIGTFYIHDESNRTSNMLILVKEDTEIYTEIDNKEIPINMTDIQNGNEIDVYTVGNPTNTIPPQITAEKIVVKTK